MAVHDHGLEAIRKASSVVTSGDTTEYKLRTFSVSGMLSESYDYVSVGYPISTQEVYTFKTGGAGGTTVATITINYTDATKANISNVAKT
jgi:hypothetical protein